MSILSENGDNGRRADPSEISALCPPHPVRTFKLTHYVCREHTDCEEGVELQER